jgi:hypothetical protein
MSDTVRRFRSLAIAFVVLALSAGVAFAAAPALRPASAPAAGTQADAPEANENEQGEDPGEQGEDAEQGDDADKPDEVEQPEAPDAEDGTPAVGTHGELVSAAAQMETPDGFANHGAFVSCVAKMKDVTLADVDWTTITAESCAAAKDAAKAERDAAKAERKAQHDAKTHGKGAEVSAEKRAEHAPAH